MRMLHPSPKWLATLLLTSSACFSGAEPAANLTISKLVAQRSADGRVAVRVEVANSGGPRNTAFCVRVEALSAAPSRLLEAREGCTWDRLDGGGSRVFEPSMSPRRTVGEVLDARINGDLVHGLASTEVPR